MNVIHAIGLKDVGYFQEVQFKIPPGISVIYGLNRASGRTSKNSNGVGKSFLFSAVPEILYDDPIVGEKSDRMRSGTRALSFTNFHGKKILIKRIAKGKSEKIEIHIDGEDQNIRKLPVAKAMMKREWPITVDDYNTYVHIDSRVPHPLVMGTSTGRKQFFTDFFGLNKFDTERKLYNAELLRLSRIRSAFVELRTQYLRAKTDLLPAERVEEITEQAFRHRKRLKTLQERFTSVQDILRLVSFGNSARDQIKTLVTACGEVTAEEFARAKKDNKWELDKITKDLEDAEAWDAYRRDNKAYTEAYNALSKLTKNAIARYGLAKARRIASKHADQRMHTSVEVMSCESQIKAFEKVLAEDIPKAVEYPAEDIEEMRTLKRVYEHHLEHAEKFEDGKCETCGQPVKIKDPALVQKKVDTVVRKIRAHKQASEYEQTMESRRVAQKEVVKWRAELDVYKAAEAKELKWEKVCHELRGLPAKPEPFTGKKLQTVVLRRMLEELSERRSLLKYLEPHLDTVIAFLALTPEDLKKVAEAEGLSDQMNAVQDRLSRAVAKLEVQKTLAANVADLRTRLHEMKAELAEEQALKYLVNGYQDKNIKKMAVEAISQRLMALINKYAAAVFPEDFRFEFEWGAQISLLVHRKYGKKTLTSDVRKLSGAESVFFTLILVCALLNFVPARKRCSVLILDEPSARLSKEMTDVLQGLLRTLNTMIPSIVIITPKSDEVYEGAKTYTVVKEKGVARIVEGMPHQVKT